MRLKAAAMVLIASGTIFASGSGVFSPYHGGRGTWPERPAPISYAIDGTFPSSRGTASDFEAAILRAAGTWTGTGKVILTASGRANRVLDTGDGVNSVFALDSLHPTKGNALATARVLIVDDTIRAFDIVFWDKRGIFGFGNVGTYDVESIALHELGHAIGLRHTAGRSFGLHRTNLSLLSTTVVRDGDFNGDGVQDLLLLEPEPGSADTRLSLVSGGRHVFQTEFTSARRLSQNATVLLGDFYRSMGDDVLVIDAVPGASGTYGAWVGRPEDGALEWARWMEWQQTSPPSVRIGDFNGDGADDVVMYDGTGFADFFVAIADAPPWLDNSSFTRRNWLTSRMEPSTRLLIGDFNADGRDDLLFDRFDRSANEQRISVALSNGLQFIESDWAKWTTTSRRVVDVGDFNADRRTDLVSAVPSNTGTSIAIVVGLSNGRLFQPARWARSPYSREVEFFVADFNGDEVDDLLWLTSAAGTRIKTFWVGQSTKTRFFVSGDGDPVGFGDGGTGPDTDMWGCFTVEPYEMTLIGNFDGYRGDDFLSFDARSPRVNRNVTLGSSQEVVEATMRREISRRRVRRALTSDELGALGCYYQ